jgi:glycosyltransferase involved in cell wall biosynthesis
MNITLYCPGGLEEWGPHTIESGLGGSESAVVYMAQELFEAGHMVTVYNNVAKQQFQVNRDGPGLVYGPVGTAKEHLKQTDILIVWRSPEAVLELKEVKAGKKYLWLHDMAEQSELLPFIHFYDKFMVLSEFHRSFYPDIPDEKFFVTRNGIAPTDIGKVKRDPMQMLYASNYDRGLLILLENWTKLKMGLPGLKLKIAYGWNTLDALAKKEGSETETEYSVFKQYVERLFDQEGIEHLGRIGKKELHSLMAGSQLMAYPCIYPETSCISLMEAQYYGAVPVVIPSGALPETVKSGYMTPAETTQADYVKLLVHALSNPGETEGKRKEGMAAAREMTWGRIANGWIAEFNGGNG